VEIVENVDSRNVERKGIVEEKKSIHLANTKASNDAREILSP
jgi:hypothetical protein